MLNPSSDNKIADFPSSYNKITEVKQQEKISNNIQGKVIKDEFYESFFSKLSIMC